MHGVVLFITLLGQINVNETRLPTGPAPWQIMAKLEGDQLHLVIPAHDFLRIDHPDGTREYKPVYLEEDRIVALKDVKVTGIDGKKISVDRLRNLLSETVPALMSVDAEPVDPLHFRLVKEGTLVIIGPTPKAVTLITE